MAKIEEGYENGPDWVFYCPGCQHHHGIWTTKPLIVNGKPNKWTFNGDLGHPTVTPSIRISRRMTGTDVDETICHSIITEGKINYLPDCKHKLAGETIEMFDI